ncbi:hypothetical protein C7C46_21515 [Streptomyces tateyamensis]|uniref:Uncharacterized protein n=1 Tax=Streptomyces tateyamensis TaxID=565073 RepID=A0A2V4NY48_9ACTN|nr:hypothetical protein [Streptomyces tateyamensis]PYC76765.1 hypothetical protein C7C46_21515 [Streptomyces tateyamensis]
MTQSQSQSQMTLRVYRIAPGGERTELSSTEVAAGQPYEAPRTTLFEEPCRCGRCQQSAALAALPGAELPSPTPAPGCATCADFHAELRVAQARTSAWSDVRVLWRRHLAAAHAVADCPGPTIVR